MSKWNYTEEKISTSKQTKNHIIKNVRKPKWTIWTFFTMLLQKHSIQKLQVKTNKRKKMSEQFCDKNIFSQL